MIKRYPTCGHPVCFPGRLDRKFARGEHILSFHQFISRTNTQSIIRVELYRIEDRRITAHHRRNDSILAIARWLTVINNLHVLVLAKHIYLIRLRDSQNFFLLPRNEGLGAHYSRYYYDITIISVSYHIIFKCTICSTYHVRVALSLHRKIPGYPIHLASCWNIYTRSGKDLPVTGRCTIVKCPRLPRGPRILRVLQSIDWICTGNRSCLSTSILNNC